MHAVTAGIGTLTDRIRAAVGAQGVVTAPQDIEPYLVDWRRRYHGASPLVVRPANTAEVAAVVKICAETRTPIVPQGGNTGMCGGSVPDTSGTQIVLSLTRMNRIREIDPANNTLTVEAGCVLANLQQAADEIDRLFPLSLGAEGSCQIGGNLSTNAGGVAVLRYGNARELVLGLEVVLPDGSILNGLRGLRKDNTGYDLKHLFVGAEGTLGIVTAAVVKLFPKPKARATVFAAIADPAAAVTLLNTLRAGCGDRVTGFELIARHCLDVLFRHIPKFADPLRERHDWYVLAELTDTLASYDLNGVLEQALAGAMEQGLVHDAVVAASEAQANTLWAMREEIPEAQRMEAIGVKHDISVPVSRVPEFIDTATAALQRKYPGVRVVAFGHIGDGNIHYNLFHPPGSDAAAFIARTPEIYALTGEIIDRLGGSISAEHGIGQLKVGDLRHHKSAVELDLMRRIKRALDPHGIMNPGKVLD